MIRSGYNGPSKSKCWKLFWATLRENILLNFGFKNEATRANLQVNKRTLKWQPFWNKVYDMGQFFRTNCAIFTSYIRADPRTLRGFSRECCHVVWSNCEELRVSLTDFSQRCQGIRLRKRSRALICSFMLWANGKGEFFRVENKTSISRCEWILISARARWVCPVKKSYERKL